MKKIFVITALIASMGIIGLQQASAANKGMGMGAGSQKGCAQYNQLDAASQAKVDKFHDDTKALRRQMMMKHAEEHAVLKTDNPDPAKAAQLAGEIFDLHETMQGKAKEAGVQDLIGQCGCMGGMGMGQGMMGPHRRGGGYGRGMMDGSGPMSDAGMPAAPPGADKQ